VLIQGKKDIVFRFIIEYKSLMDFGGPLVIALFLYEDVLKDEILASIGNLRLIVIIEL
jgi:hypothetical protein